MFQPRELGGDRPRRCIRQLPRVRALGLGGLVDRLFEVDRGVADNLPGHVVVTDRNPVEPSREPISIAFVAFI
jgi:hypothetical protein